MNEDLNAQRPSAEERVASFARDREYPCGLRARGRAASPCRGDPRTRRCACWSAARARGSCPRGAQSKLRHRYGRAGARLERVAAHRSASGCGPRSRECAACADRCKARRPQSDRGYCAVQWGIGARQFLAASCDSAGACRNAGRQYAALGRAQQMTLRANFQSGAQDNEPHGGRQRILRHPELARAVACASSKYRDDTHSGRRRASHDRRRPPRSKPRDSS